MPASPSRQRVLLDVVCYLTASGLIALGLHLAYGALPGLQTALDSAGMLLATMLTIGGTLLLIGWLVVAHRFRPADLGLALPTWQPGRRHPGMLTVIGLAYLVPALVAFIVTNVIRGPHEDAVMAGWHPVLFIVLPALVQLAQATLVTLVWVAALGYLADRAGASALDTYLAAALVQLPVAVLLVDWAWAGPAVALGWVQLWLYRRCRTLLPVLALQFFGNGLIMVAGVLFGW